MNKFRHGLNKILAFIISILLTIMTSLVLWQIITRYLLNDPSIFTEELVRIILIWTSFLGAAYAFGNREHMSLIFLRDKSKGHMKVFITALIDLAILIFALIIMIYGGHIVTRSVLAIKTPILGISKAYMYVSYMIAGGIVAVYQVINLIEDFKVNRESN